MEPVDPTYLATLEPLRASFQQRPSSTIKPVGPDPTTAARSALALLGRLGVREDAVRIGSTLGHGGMGVVRLAEQVALGRTIAVKTLKAEARSEGATLALLREAWVTGALEHPNVVPVHDVGMGEDGAPYILMKRIEGTEWRVLIHDAAAVRTRYGAADVLEWHLRILIQICNAVHFAHTRGVLHRDLKPENVMVGAFGEVYVVDWGLALGLRGDFDGRLPPAAGRHLLAGTPAYMAPEMLDGAALDERTDVYLLGGMLYEVLSKRVPHRGDALEEILDTIRTSRPPAPEGPEEIVGLCLRALSADPAERPPSAEAFRRAIEEFLAHRGSVQIAEQAEVSARLLERALASEAPDPTEVHHLHAEASFGFRMALGSWSGNDVARARRASIAEAVARFELGRGDPRAAHAIVAEIADVPAALRAEIAAAVAAEEARNRAVAALVREQDVRVGQRTRWFLAVLMGVVWTVMPLLVAPFLTDASDTFAPSHARNVGYSTGFVVMLVLLGVWARESMTATSLNRNVMVMMIAAPLGQVAMSVSGWLLGAEPRHVMALHFSLWFTLAWVAATVLDRRLAPAVVGYFVAMLGASLRPDHVLAWLSVGNGVLLVCVLALWFPGRARLLGDR